MLLKGWVVCSVMGRKRRKVWRVVPVQAPVRRRRTPVTDTAAGGRARRRLLLGQPPTERAEHLVGGRQVPGSRKRAPAVPVSPRVSVTTAKCEEVFGKDFAEGRARVQWVLN